ncbi:prepilin-type N-terminal cleavage/methylation domain-containing protein [bacterium]|nr:prepilin-type N-terminal cleavage/methylation domain-containing protein [bacterium]
MRKRGFTLIELLVVIAIIAILAAILFPVFAGAKEKARQTVCLKHGGQLGMALNLYLDDHNGKFPLCWMFRPGDSTLTWAHGLYKYTKSLDVYTCPSVPSRRFTADTTAGYSADADRKTGGWGYNTSDGGGGKANGVGRGKNSNMYTPDPYNISDLVSASRHIAFGDSKSSDDSDIAYLFPGYTGRNAFNDVIKALTSGSFYVPPDFRHNGGAIFIFCDGHAKWFNKTYIYNWQTNGHYWYVDNRSH